VKYGIEVAPLNIDIFKIVVLIVLVGISIIILNSYQGIPLPVLIMIVLALIFLTYPIKPYLEEECMQ